jgi:hypothetical protein
LAWSSSKPSTPPSNSFLTPDRIHEIIVKKRRTRALYQYSRLPSIKQIYN